MCKISTIGKLNPSKIDQLEEFNGLHATDSLQRTLPFARKYVIWLYH